MSKSTTGRIAFALPVAAATLLFGAAATAAPSSRAVEAMSNRSAAANTELPSRAMENSGLRGVLNPGVLSASGVALTLADGSTLTARLQRIVRDDAKGTQSWVGTFDESPGSVLVLSRAKGVVTGFANIGADTFEIMPASSGKHVLYEVDETRLPKGEVILRPQAQSADSASGLVSDFGTGGSVVTADSNVVQDVMVLYTAASAARYGQGSLESQIQSAIQAANQAYRNSLVQVTLNLVALQQSTVVEQSTMNATAQALFSDQGVARLRDQVGADMVVLVSENTDYCGLSSLMTTNSTSFAQYAFSVVQSGCLSNQTLAHELGHQQGITHDRANATYQGAYPYGYGYGVCTSDSSGFRDIMSYPCGGTPRVLLFSNPNVNWNGYPAGISYEADPSRSAENARALNNTAATVAAFRAAAGGSSGPTSPAAPAGLTVQAATFNQVSLTWSDKSSNESGFQLERSTDGVNFGEIATLGADTVTYTDSSVAAKTSYYYRVRAFNGSGVSAYSSTVNVVTPDMPLTAPTSVSASGNADGTATVSWSGVPGAATSVEVMRETWNSRKSRWGGATTAAVVPSSVTTIADTTGAGVFRYWVRAISSSSASAYAGPAEANVTSASASKRGRKR